MTQSNDTAKFHVFAGDYEDGGMSTYKGLLTLEEASTLIGTNWGLWYELASVAISGALVLVADYEHEYEEVSPVERYHVGYWHFFAGDVKVEVFRFHQIWQPPERFAPTPVGLVGGDNTIILKFDPPMMVTGMPRSGWVEDPL